MRRIVLAARASDPPGEIERVAAWLRTLPIGGLTLVDRVRDAALEQADVLWVRAPVDPDPRLADWLKAGGRLLATHQAASVLHALGVEPESPRSIPLPDPLPAGFGLAGFGSHPLFAGLRQGAVIVPAGTSESRSMWGYSDGRRPRAAEVVAVERHGLAIVGRNALAWECSLGAGGVLCLALEPGLGAEPGGEAEVVLANALLGDAIPHRDRAGPAPVWPQPGRTADGGVREKTLLAAPLDAWPETSGARLDLAPRAAWTHAGRRMLIGARAGSGRRDAWVPPFRVMRDAAVLDAIPCAPSHIAADEVAGGLAVQAARLVERWVAAADAPVLAWEIGGPKGIGVQAEWVVDLRRAWPFPEGAYGDLRFTLSEDGLSLGVEAAGGPRVRFAAAGGRIEVAAEAAAVRVTCRGVTPLRIVCAAGADDDELERGIRLLERDGVGGLAAARSRKAAQIERYGTAFEAPDEMLGRGFAWARLRGDEALVGAPGIGRSVLAACPAGAPPDAWCFGAGACAGAAALLVAGHREPARELLKFLTQAQHPGGGIPAWHPVSGLASPPDPRATLAFLGLSERLLAWAGEDEALRRMADPLTRALAWLAERDGPPPAARVLDALDALAGPAAQAAIAELRRRDPGGRVTEENEAHAIVEAAAAALRRTPGSLHGMAAPALLESVAALWGLDPAAPDAALAVSPALPEGWSGCALRRLRVGRSMLDLELRRRPAAIVLRAALLFGPRIVLTAGLRGPAVASTEVDDVPLAGPRARFEAHARHEVRFHLLG